MRILRRSGALHNATLLLASVLIAFASAEIVLRAAGVGYPRRWQPDPILGRALIPGQQLWHSAEGHASVRINSTGFRDDERRLTKPANTVRIALLGDSFVEAPQVAKEDRFGELLQRRLTNAKAFGEKTVEVLNFGVSGHGTDQELLIFHHFASRYSPDIVLLAFFAGNDLLNNVRSLEQKPFKPYYVIKNGDLELDRSFLRSSEYGFPWRRRFAFFFIDRSHVLQLIYRVLEQWGETPRNRARAGVAAAAGVEEVGINQMVFAPPSVPEWAQAWTVTEAILRQLNKDVESKGASLLVVTLTVGAQVSPDPKARARLQTQLGVPDLMYPDDRIRRLGERHGFAVLSLGRPFQEFADKQHAYLHGFENRKLGAGHWNEQGHRLAAEIIASEIQALSKTNWTLQKSR